MSGLIDGTTRRQIARFLVAGICAVGTDTVVYFLLIYPAGVGHNPAKMASFVAGTFVAYLINKFWTFESPKKSALEAVLFFGLYVMTMFLNVGVNHAVLTWIWREPVAAFITATGTSAASNFLGQKFVVFRGRADG